MRILDFYFNMLSGLDKDSIRRDLTWLFRETLADVSPEEWANCDLSDEAAAVLADGVDRLAKGEPLAYILGDAEFYWCKIGVSPDVLIPRPETEGLCDLAIRQNRGKSVRALDLCTGSGCIAIALKKTCPDWEVVAVDVSLNALNMARSNAESNNAEILFVESDMWQNVTGTFDVLVSNPPYIDSRGMTELPQSVKDFEPHLALYGGEDGLDFYRDIAARAPEFLAPDGRIYLEVGDGQAGAVADLLQENFVEIEILRDLYKVERYVVARRK